MWHRVVRKVWKVFLRRKASVLQVMTVVEQYLKLALLLRSREAKIRFHQLLMSGHPHMKNMTVGRKFWNSSMTLIKASKTSGKWQGTLSRFLIRLSWIVSHCWRFIRGTSATTQLKLSISLLSISITSKRFQFLLTRKMSLLLSSLALLESTAQIRNLLLTLSSRGNCELWVS